MHFPKAHSDLFLQGTQSGFNFGVGLFDGVGVTLIVGDADVVGVGVAVIVEVEDAVREGVVV